MKRFLTAFSLILTLVFVNSSFAQVGVILEGETTPSIQKITEKENTNVDLISLRNTIMAVIDHSVSIAMFSSGFGTCSGVVIKNTEKESVILTAKHCIGTVEELYVEGILATDVGISFYDDIAYIKLGQMIPNKTPVKISEFTPKKGDIAIAIGYPSLELHVGIGKMDIKTKDWQFALINIIPGCSGGGVYNDYGELVGIVWGTIGDKDDLENAKIGIFERLEDVVRFVKKHKLLEE